MQIPSSWLRTALAVVERVRRVALDVGFTIVTIANAVIPDAPPAVPPGLDVFARTIISWLRWGVGFAAVGGILIAALMMAVGRRNRNALAVDGAASLPWSAAALAVASTAVGLVSLFLWPAS